MEKYKYTSQSDRDQFEKDGYCILPNLLSVEDVEKYKLTINKVFDLPNKDLLMTDVRKTYALADGVTKNSDFWPLIYNDYLIGFVSELLNGDIKYTQHSDIHINLGGGRFHRDGRCREFGIGSDWEEDDHPYALVRIGFYLSDFKDTKSSVILLPGTHKKETRITRFEYIIWNKVRSFFRKFGANNWLPHVFFSNRRIVHKSKAGDCVIFHQRLLHAGGTLLNTKKPKYAIFTSYGLNNQHSYNHVDYYFNQRNDLDYLKSLPKNLHDKLKSHDLLLKR
jgi:hypothetical protein